MVDHGALLNRTQYKAGELFHIDIQFKGVTSINRNIISCAFVEDRSRVNDPIFLSKKSNVGDEIKKKIIFYQRQTGNQVKRIRADQAPEFIKPGSDLRKWCDTQGIITDYSSKGASQENGIAENANRWRKETGITIRMQRDWAVL